MASKTVAPGEMVHTLVPLWCKIVPMLTLVVMLILTITPGGGNARKKSAWSK
jgi:hypothetical protein